ncbi:VWA domain-containing protein [Agarilytica rhodophyticola]|uniref:VWA domain-containing protein n=1 Tax=Agarilytica rhodophyticola TaxID=1737490 RepID=UPI000B347F67|nr:vWA domain-containing protein [Agarilytica rhodophyticola]
MICRLKALRLSLFFIIYCTCFSSYGQTAAEPLPPDVRLVIDVSGSMKQNDPNNLRQPAVDLLVQLLPEEGKAGIWTFGRWVNMLVKHQAIDEKWRKDASQKSKEINSLGLFTNIGEALEKALYDIENQRQDHRTSIILLTDGMVDIDKDPTKNKKEWRRIVDDILPKIKNADVTVHTIALSDNADTDLLNKLSLGTDGIAAVAKSADDLMTVFLKAFDVAAPMEEVPLSDDGFVVDSSVEEFTALIFRSSDSKQTQLIGPDKEVVTSSTSSKYVSWYKGDNYDLITIKQPLEGQWDVVADMAPNSRVTVVSNLNLRVKPLPNNILRDQQESVSFFLQEDGNKVTRAEFLSLMDISMTMLGGQDEFDLREIWSSTLDTQNPPKDGMFTVALPNFDKEGIYQLSILVDGKSFVREFNHQFTTRQPFGADIEQVFNDGKVEYVLIARSYNGDVDIDKTQVSATVVSPDGRKKIRPLSSTDVDTWQTNIRPEIEGEYIANIKIRGQTQDGNSFNVELDPVRFNYSIDDGFVENKEDFFEEEKASPEPTKTAAPEATAEPAKEEDSVNEEGQDAESEGLPDWVLYVALGLGNLLLFGLGFLVFRKIMGGNKDEEILEQFSEEKITEGEDETEQAEPEQEDELEEEPPMEDLDPIDDSDEGNDDEANEPEVFSPEPEVFDADTQNAEIEADSTQEDNSGQSEAGETETAQDQDFAADNNDDPLDDLDEMAMVENIDEQETQASAAQDAPADASQGDEGSEAGEDEEGEEDMVAAMLKAQGLDLAEDELDDAISSLIDELENDESLDDMDDD